MSKPIIATIIVTYNRSQKLTQSIEHVLKQSTASDKIFIIDNASTDETPEIIKQYNQKYEQITPIILSKNTGGAGGFYTGIKEAYHQGADYIWIMDDDCYPEVDALQNLLKSYDFFDEQKLERPAFAASHVLWKDGKFSNLNPLSPRNDWSRYYTKNSPYALLKAASFVSVLIPKESIEEFGLPIKEYFIWFDDIEYTQRLSRRGQFYGVGVMNSIVVHDSASNITPDLSLVDDSNIWKYAYNIRNNAAYRLHQRSNPFAFIGYGLKMKRQFKKAHLSKAYVKKLKKAYWSALKFKPTIEYVQKHPKD
ncbi:MAG: glycosyltransferase family 2 protein [Alphaproteobacteria bacterium]